MDKELRTIELQEMRCSRSPNGKHKYGKIDFGFKVLYGCVYCKIEFEKEA